MESTLHNFNRQNCVNFGSRDIRELSQKLNRLTDSADKWVEVVLSKNNLTNNFESAVDALLEQDGLHVLPNHYIEDMQLSLRFLSVWLLNSINSAKLALPTPAINASLESVMHLCKKGFQEANGALLTCVQSLCPDKPIEEGTIKEESADSMYALYAFLEDFDSVECYMLHELLDEKDILSCPKMPPNYHQESLLALFQDLFKEVVIDQKEFLLNLANKMCKSLTSNPVFLQQLSQQIIKSESVYA